MSPIARCIKVLAKYGLLYEMLQWLESGMLPSKSLWRKMVKRTIMESYHSNWRFEIKFVSQVKALSNNTNMYSTIVLVAISQVITFS